MPTHKRFKTPYKNRVAKPSRQRKAEIKAQLEHDKQEEDIRVDDEGNVLDGHTRYDILGDAVSAVVVNGFQSEAEKLAYVDKRDSGNRKNHTPAQAKDLAARRKANARVLIAEGLTQQQAAGKLGVCQRTVSNWCGSSKVAKTRNSSQKNGPTEEQIEIIRKGVTEGKPNSHIAQELGVHPSTVAKYIANLKLQRPRKKLGQMPKAISKRALYCRDLQTNGKSKAAALEQCEMKRNNYTRALRVAQQGGVDLIGAMDAESLTINGAHALLGVSGAKVKTAIVVAKEKKAAKERKAATADGKNQDRVAILSRLINRTYADWLAFQKNTLSTTGWIPSKGKKADDIRQQLVVMAQTVEGAVGVIHAKLGGTNGNH